MPIQDRVVGMLSELVSWWPAILLAVEIGLRVLLAARVVQRGPNRYASSLAWILVILLLPVAVGVVAWLLLGEARLGRKRREEYARLAEEIGVQMARVGSAQHHRCRPEGYEFAVALAEAVGGTPPRDGNALELMGNTDGVIDRLVDDLDGARDHAHLLFYIYLDDGTGRRVAEALKRAARRGVICRLLVDGVGSSGFLDSALRGELEDSGVIVVAALPVSLLRAAFARVDLRNHRKIVVIDGCLGYTGSQNVADASFAPKKRYAPWVDCMVRVRGPVVRDLQAIFLTDWYVDSGEPLESLLASPIEPVDGGVPAQVLPTGPTNDLEALTQLSIGAIHHAREEIIFTTPYFVPGEAELGSLCTAARRGVRVVVIVPARNDSRLVGAVSRSHYRELLEAGVEVHEYQKGLLHAKTTTVDRDLALVTTANFDRRSFELNFEVSMLVYDSDFASHLRFLQTSYLTDSRPVRLDDVRRRGYFPRLVDNAAGIFSPLL